MNFISAWVERNWIYSVLLPLHKSRIRSICYNPDILFKEIHFPEVAGYIHLLSLAQSATSSCFLLRSYYTDGKGYFWGKLHLKNAMHLIYLEILSFGKFARELLKFCLVITSSATLRQDTNFCMHGILHKCINSYIWHTSDIKTSKHNTIGVHYIVQTD